MVLSPGAQLAKSVVKQSVCLRCRHFARTLPLRHTVPCSACQGKLHSLSSSRQFYSLTYITVLYCAQGLIHLDCVTGAFTAFAAKYDSDVALQGSTASAAIRRTCFSCFFFFQSYTRKRVVSLLSRHENYMSTLLRYYGINWFACFPYL